MASNKICNSICRNFTTLIRKLLGVPKYQLNPFLLIKSQNLRGNIGFSAFLYHLFYIISLECNKQQDNYILTPSHFSNGINLLGILPAKGSKQLLLGLRNSVDWKYFPDGASQNSRDGGFGDTEDGDMEILVTLNPESYWYLYSIYYQRHLALAGSKIPFHVRINYCKGLERLISCHLPPAAWGVAFLG